MDAILTIIRFVGILFLVILVFNFMILIHELGHFLAARWRGLVVDRFYIWFGKPLWKKTVNGVEYGLGSIPAGGFVSLPQMATMEGIEGEVAEGFKKDLPPVKPLDKIIVAAAGPLFSLLLAAFFAVISWQVGYPRGQRETSTVVGALQDQGAAKKAGLQPGDRIISIGGNPVDKFSGMGNSIIWQVVSAPVGPLEFVVDRNGEQKAITVMIEEPKQTSVPGGPVKRLFSWVFSRPPLPTIGLESRFSAIVAETKPNSPAAEVLKPRDKILEVDGEPAFVDNLTRRNWIPGSAVTMKILRDKQILEVEVKPRKPEIFEINTPEAKERFAKNPPPMLGATFDYRGDMTTSHEDPVKIIRESAKSIFKTLQKVFSPDSAIKGGHLSGPAGIVGVLYDFLKMEDGWKMVIYFGALLNVNLAILNLLPFPVLDGGHIVMSAIEWIRRRPAPAKLLAVVQNAFVLLIFGFMIFVTFKDVGDRLPTGNDQLKDRIEWTPIAVTL